jgi:hypothetical protein
MIGLFLQSNFPSDRYFAAQAPRGLLRSTNGMLA